MIVAVVVISAVTLAALIIVVWILSNIRSDQLMIRQFMAHELRAKRADRGAPTDDEGFARWLQTHPERPHRHDPPAGRIT